MSQIIVDELIKKSTKNRKRYIAIEIVLLVLMLLIIVVSVSLGDADIKLSEILKIITGKFFLNNKMLSAIEPYKISIVWDIRLPRIITGALVGAGLAVAGAVFQGLLLNPLADPYTIGVSTGAAFGASLTIYLNLFLMSVQLPVIPFSFLGALLTLLLVIKIANRKGVINTSNLIIAGIIVSSILSAGISFIKNAAGEEVAAIVFWLMGSLTARKWQQVYVALPVIVICILICIKYAQSLNILCLGEKEAKGLGVDTYKMRKIFLVIGSILTGVCVAISGIIGFVGLVVPHMLRFTFTSDNKVLIPLSALTGAAILMIADNISRIMFAQEIPVGVLTTLIGGPFFIYIFIKRNIYM